MAAKMTKQKRNKIRQYVRAAIQLLYFIFFPSVYTASFNGVKYIFTQIGAHQKVEITSFVAVFIALCIYTIIFGRFFCGFACAFGAFGDALRAIYVFACKKLKKKQIKIPAQAAKYLSVVKYIILAAIVILSWAGVYGNLQGTSPWDVFSMLHAGNFRLDSYVVGIIMLLLIMIGMCLQERFFCRFLCPMGAVFALLPTLPFFTLKRDRGNCLKGCSACERTCPSGIGLPTDGSLAVSGDCFMCQKCTNVCPKTNIHTGIKVIRGNEEWFSIIRAAILLGICVWLGV